MRAVPQYRDDLERAMEADGLLVTPTKCCMTECGNDAQVGSWCSSCWRLYTSLESLWERQTKWEGHERRRVHLAGRALARRWRFINSFVLMLLIEMLIGDCLGVLGLWQNWLLCFAWAFLIAVLAALFG